MHVLRKLASLIFGWHVATSPLMPPDNAELDANLVARPHIIPGTPHTPHGIPFHQKPHPRPHHSTDAELPSNHSCSACHPGSRPGHAASPYERPYPSWDAAFTDYGPPVLLCFEAAYEVSPAGKAHWGAAAVTPEEAVCSFNLGSVIPRAAQCVTKLAAVNYTAGEQDFVRGVMREFVRFCSDVGVEMSWEPWQLNVATAAYDTTPGDMRDMYQGKQIPVSRLQHAYGPGTHSSLSPSARRPAPPSPPRSNDWGYIDGTGVARYIDPARVRSRKRIRRGTNLGRFPDPRFAVEEAFLQSPCALEGRREAARCLARNERGVLFEAARGLRMRLYLEDPGLAEPRVREALTVGYQDTKRLAAAYNPMFEASRRGAPGGLCMTQKQFAEAGLSRREAEFYKMYPRLFRGSRWDTKGRDLVNHYSRPSRSYWEWQDQHGAVISTWRNSTSRSGRGVPSVSTALKLAGGDLRGGAGDRRWWPVFGQVAAFTQGLGLSAGLGLGIAYDWDRDPRTPAMKEADVGLYVRYLAEHPDLFMKDLEKLLGYENLEVMSAWHGLQVAAGHDEPGDAFEWPASDILAVRWGHNDSLAVATGEWAMCRARDWYASAVGRQVWDIADEIGRLLSPSYTGEQAIYRFLLTEHLVAEIEGAVAPGLYGSDYNDPVTYVLEELARRLGIVTSNADIWHLVDRAFHRNYTQFQMDRASYWHTEQVQAKIREAISLYLNGRGGPMLVLGIGDPKNKTLPKRS